jgi:UDP-glucose 4-epimerase
MQQTVLITGGFGFLGRAVAGKFKQLGFRVVGIGHGQWGSEKALANGFDIWLDANITLSSLMTVHERFDLVIHCGGNGSVGYSFANPLQDFSKTVQGTIEMLEFLQLTESKALLVYPSSAGVYGAKDDAPIKETDSLNPISPYGYHKRMAEELIESYSKSYGIRAVVIRFFSIYGPGLTKQLLWDASMKLRTNGNGEVIFWGTGEETRDWINIGDAADLIVSASRSIEKFCIINGASGIRVTVRQTLEILKVAMDNKSEIVFNGTSREGDPRFYHADISRALSLCWKPTTTLHSGIQQYARWLAVL